MPAAREIASQQVFSRAQTPSESRLERKHSTTGSLEKRIAPSTALGPPLMSFKNGVIGVALATWSAETPSFSRALALRAALVKRTLYARGFLDQRETEDKAEKIAQAQQQKNWKYMLLLGLVATAANLGDELFHWIFGGSGRYMVTSWINVATVILLVGCVFNWIGTDFQEIRTRTKEINGKLTELKATLEELKERL